MDIVEQEYRCRDCQDEGKRTIDYGAGDVREEQCHCEKLRIMNNKIDIEVDNFIQESREQQQ